MKSLCIIYEVNTRTSKLSTVCCQYVNNCNWIVTTVTDRKKLHCLCAILQSCLTTHTVIVLFEICVIMLSRTVTKAKISEQNVAYPEKHLHGEQNITLDAHDNYKHATLPSHCIHSLHNPQFAMLTKTHRRQRGEGKFSPAKCLRCTPARVSTPQVPAASGDIPPRSLPHLCCRCWRSDTMRGVQAVLRCRLRVYCSTTQNSPVCASSPRRCAATRLQLSSA